MQRRLRALSAVSITACCALSWYFPAALKAADQQQIIKTEAGKKRSQPGKYVLRPSKDSDFDLAEAILTVTPDGRGKVKMSGPLKPGLLNRSIVIVDVDNSMFHAFALDKPSQDAKRLHRFFQERGVSSDETELLDYFTRDKQRSEEQQSAWQRDLEAEPIESGPSACTADWDTGRLACEGSGYAKVETWEPAKYIFPVTHLTETWTSAWWTREAGSISANRDGRCWANPFTFVATFWIELACIPQFTNYSTSFDATTVGSYLNWNFLLDSAAVTVTASASVQYTYGMPNWGITHEINNLGLFNFYEGLFLSFQPTGWANEWGCSSCNPEGDTVHACEHQTDFYTWDWDICECVQGASPIVIDLDGDGFDLTSAEAGVSFDLMNDGIHRRVAWTAADGRDAFLILDRNGNGIVDSGSELFGNFSPQASPPKKESKNGFLALAAFDESSEGGNRDSSISAEDAIYARLRLWIDSNHDGISQTTELSELSQMGVRSISLKYKTGKKADEHGNVFRYRSDVTVDPQSADNRRASARRLAVDVYFQYVH